MAIESIKVKYQGEIIQIVTTTDESGNETVKESKTTFSGTAGEVAALLHASADQITSGKRAVGFATVIAAIGKSFREQQEKDKKKGTN